MVLHSYISVPVDTNSGTTEYMRINLEELCGMGQKKPVSKKPEPQPPSQSSVITKLCDILYRNSKI